MEVEFIVKKYSLVESDLNKIMTLMLSDIGLDEAERRFGGRLNREQIYAVASFICSHHFNDTIDSVSPKFSIDRISIHESRKSEIAAKRLQIENERKEKAILEDLMLYRIEQSRKKKSIEVA